MKKGIILRVLKGTELSPELSHTLGALLPDYTLEYFEAKPDYRLSIARRLHSLYESFLLILDAYPLNPKFTVVSADTLKLYAQECLSSCTLKADSSLEELHKVLETFTAKLIEPLSVCWAWGDKDSVKEAVACLNEAEQSLLRLKGRDHTATLTAITLNDKIEYVLQYDKVLPAYYDALMGELKSIKSNNYPRTPVWFRELDEHEQAFFCYRASNKSLRVTDVLNQLNEFLICWQNIKRQYGDLAQQLTRINSNTTPLPEWYTNLAPSCKEMLLVLSKESEAEITKKLNAFKQKIATYTEPKTGKADNELKTLDLIATIPQWYWALSGRKQIFLQHVMRSATSLEDVFAFVCSRDRDLPMPSNYCAHHMYLINSEAQATRLGGVRYRSSHIANRDALNYPVAVQLHHCRANFAKVTEFAGKDKPILFQTLISPIFASAHVPKGVKSLLPELPPDYELYEIAKKTVARSHFAHNTLIHNHPYNLAKYVYYTESKDADSIQTITAVKDYIEPVNKLAQLIKEGDLAELLDNNKLAQLIRNDVLKQSIKDASKDDSVKQLIKNAATQQLSLYTELQQLVDEYIAVLQSPIGSATFWDYDGRELFLSSLEQLIVLKMEGHSYGSCVSGKDRKAIELIHTDAMLLYREFYGNWPRFNASKEQNERILFIDIIVELYLSRHQHVLAGQNAPGSEGIKTPYWYLPKDICDAINLRAKSSKSLEYDDRLATDNEVKNICGTEKLKSYMSNANAFLGYLVAKQLGEAACTQLYDTLSRFINEQRKFHPKNTWVSGSSLPAGILDIQLIMRDRASGDNNVQRVAKIFCIVLQRPEDDKSRTPETRSVYDGIRKICVPGELEKVGPLLHTVATQVIGEWQELFDASKEELKSAIKLH